MTNPPACPRCEALTAALREIAELRLDESLDAPLAQARARREMHEIAAVALATSEQARTEEGMLYHLDGTPYMNVADYFESPAEQAEEES